MTYIEITETNARKLNPTKWVLQARLYRDGTSEVLSKFAETPAGLANLSLGSWGGRNVPVVTIAEKDRDTLYSDVAYGARKDRRVSQEVINQFNEVYLPKVSASVPNPASLEDTIAVRTATA